MKEGDPRGWRKIKHEGGWLKIDKTFRKVRSEKNEGRGSTWLEKN